MLWILKRSFSIEHQRMLTKGQENNQILPAHEIL